MFVHAYGLILYNFPITRKILVNDVINHIRLLNYNSYTYHEFKRIFVIISLKIVCDWEI